MPADIVTRVEELLPVGWRAERRIATSDRHVIIIAPDNRGAVTVDLDARFYQLGYGIRAPRVGNMKAKYRGRGWFQRLVRDAVAALQEALR